VIQAKLGVGRGKDQLEQETEQKPVEVQPNNKTGLPGALKAGIEAISGISMDTVRVHYNSSKPTQLQAQAYTQGKDIYLAPGQARHLSHEVWHVVQQQQGRVKPTIQGQGISINDDQKLEQEADVMGAKAMQQSSAKAYFGPSPLQQQSNPPSQSVMQFWNLPGNVKTHIFDGEARGNMLVGMHSQARRTTNGADADLIYESPQFVQQNKPYRVRVRVKIGDTWYPKQVGPQAPYKWSDMFPASWNEAKVTQAIEQAYDNKVNFRGGNKDIGNAKGIAIVFAGRDAPATVYPRI
jgi:hypothetical protein